MSKSRRKRRVRLVEESGLLKKWLFRGVIVCVILFVLSLIVGYFCARSYLRGTEFRGLLEKKVGEAAHAEVQLSPIQMDGRLVRLDSIELSSEDGPVQSARIEGLDVEVDYGKLWDRVVFINELTIGRLRADIAVPGLALPSEAPGGEPDGSLAAEGEGEAAGEVAVVKKPGFWASHLPNRIEFAHVAVNGMDVNFLLPVGTVSLEGVKVDLNRETGAESVKVSLKGGRYSLPFDLFARGELDAAYIRLSRDRLSISDLKVKVGSNGRLAVEGDWNLKTGQPEDLNMVVQGVLLSELLKPQWLKSVQGELGVVCNVRPGGEGQPVYQGEASLDKGVLTSMPILDTLAAFTSTSRFRHIEWSTARTRFVKAGDVLKLDDILLVCEGLVRIEGNMEIRGENLSGQLMVGVPPGLLARIPGAEESVFSAGSNEGKMGLLWAPVTLSGTLKSPREDLTRRLVAAAGTRLFRLLPGGRKVLNFSESAADRLLDQVVPQGPEGEGKSQEGEDPSIRKGEDLLRKGLEMGIDLLGR